MFALWISKLFSSAAPFTLTQTHGRDKDGLRRFGVYSRAACVECNAGWMSKLEQAVAPTLGPVFIGERAAWGLDEQLLVATWAFKTALMLDRSNPAGWKVPLEHFAYVHAHGRPPDAAEVTLGFYRPNVGEQFRGATAGISKGPTTHRSSYRICFNVGHAVFSVYGYAGKGRAFHVQQSAVLPSKLWIPLGDAFPPVWPRLAAEFVWPPPDGLAFDNNGLDLLSEDPLMAPLLVRPLAG